MHPVDNDEKLFVGVVSAEKKNACWQRNFSPVQLGVSHI